MKISSKEQAIIGFIIFVFCFAFCLGGRVRESFLEDCIRVAYAEGQKSLLVEVIEGEIKVASR